MSDEAVVIIDCDAETVRVEGTTVRLQQRGRSVRLQRASMIADIVSGKAFELMRLPYDELLKLHTQSMNEA